MWQLAALPQTAAGYVDMFASQGMAGRRWLITAPRWRLQGKQDALFMRSRAILESYKSLCTALSVCSIESAAHYPMQDVPPLTYTLIDRFLTQGAIKEL